MLRRLAWLGLAATALQTSVVLAETSAAKTRFGLHFGHYSDAATPVTVAQVFAFLKDVGATAVRHNAYWDAYQTEQPIAFDAAAATASPHNYALYLKARGYGEDAENLNGILGNLQSAHRNGLALTFNLNVIPEWAKRAPQLDPANPKSFQQIDNAALGLFLRDFITLSAQKHTTALEAISGFQVFNEVGGWVRKYTAGYGFNVDHQLPYTDYFEILDHAIAQKNLGFSDAKKSNPALAKMPVPPVVGPNLGATYNPRFFHELFKYKPLNPESINAAGQLKLEAIAMHPYGITVRPFVDVVLEDAMDMKYNDNNAWRDVSDNLTYNRSLMPTDDWMTMGAMIARNPANSKAWGLYRYADKGYTADKYFDRNAEVGVERTMAVLAQNGYGALPVFLTEFGASAFGGMADGRADALHATTFADPYKYGFVPMNGHLSGDTALNLQAETLLQTVGLIESWDFVVSATAYEVFDGEGDGEQESFGVAHSTLASGQLALKPAGQAYRAYLRGAELHQLQPAGQGVDIHIAAKGDTNGFKHAQRAPAMHELVLLRDGDDVFDAAAGDDVVFGGDGNDALAGGDGYDRLYGGFGDDHIDGGDGDDRIKGDAGDDVLTGGTGRDDFVFAAYAKTGSGFSGHDVITDFNSAVDTLSLIGALPLAEILSPHYAKDEKDGVQLFYAGNGASIVLRGVALKQLTDTSFRLLNAEKR